MIPETSPRPEEHHPVHLLEWTDTDDGRVTVLLPKYGTGRLGRWLSGRLSGAYCRIRLDEYGSFVWKRCDGERTVREIADALLGKTREPLEDLRVRLGLFLYQMRRRGMIGWAEERSRPGE